MKGITVIDSIMGSGKTTWAINYMKSGSNNLNKSFIYITPYLTETDRITEALPDMDFRRPYSTNSKGSKLEGIKTLFRNRENIATTHKLFQMFDLEILELLKKNNYVLILDEVIEVVEKFDFSEEDEKILIDAGVLAVENNWLHWKKPDYNGKTLRHLQEKCQFNNIYKYDKDFYLWTFPRVLFEVFSEAYLLTYLFDGSYQKYYFDLMSLQYEKKSIKDGVLTEYNPNQVTEEIRNLLKIHYDEKLNAVGAGYYTLSKTDIQGKSKKTNKDNPNYSKEVKKKLKDNAYNFFRNIADTKSEENMWTCHSDFKKDLRGKGYTKGWVAFNCRATNMYSNKKSLAYLMNRFELPHIKNFFAKNGIETNSDIIALSELVQWIFRSAIRNKQEINVYIPNERMRELLELWLHNKLEFSVNCVNNSEILTEE